MGIDLKLLVVECDCGHWGYAHTMLETGRNYELHDAIRAQNPFPQPNFKLHSYLATIPDGSLEGEPCYGIVEETPYSEPLTYLTATALLRAFDMIAELSKQAQATKAYLRELSETTLVALYWH